MNKGTKCRSIIEWENAINNRVDIEFVEILLNNRTVLAYTVLSFIMGNVVVQIGYAMAGVITMAAECHILT